MTLLVVLGAAFVLLVRRQQQERRLRATAERESQEKSRFLTTLSHELRTPLHGVLGYADQLIHEGGLSTEQSRQLGEIVRAGKHMRDVVNVVLDYARIEALGPKLHMKRVDVRGLIEECMAVVEPGARARGLEMRNTAAPDAPAQFVTDDIQLRQILVNLLSNAVKYTPSGMIELRLSGDAEHLMIEVADTGIGIPEGQRHHLFNEYERFGAERTSIEGTGLGLAIAHRLARRLGGHMGHRDNPGGGSVFWLELPAGVPDKPGVVAEPEAAWASRAAERAGHGRFGCQSRRGRRVPAQGGTHDERGPRWRQGGSARCGTRLRRCADGHAHAWHGRAGGDAVHQGTGWSARAGSDRGGDGECARSARGGMPSRRHVGASGKALHAGGAARCRGAGGQETPATGLRYGGGDRFRQRGSACRLHGRGCSETTARSLALRIELLVRQIEDPAGSPSPDELAALAHELVGSAGTLGFSRLAAAARRFENSVATGGSADATEMRQEATAALSELRRRPSLDALLSY